MRQPYQPCAEHNQPYCVNPTCKNDETNSGAVTPNTNGGLSVGIGSGLAVDLTDGSIGLQVGGITIDS